MSLILDKVSHVYSPGNAYETVAIKDVSLKIEDNEFTYEQALEAGIKKCLEIILKD